MSFHVIDLYMHEVATHSDTPDDCKLQPSESLLGSDTPLPLAHINALSACLTAIDGIFDVFLSLDVHTIRCLPVFNFVRVAYAVVVLIKLYFTASSPKSELGKVINKGQMKVEEHLDNLLDKFRAAAADDRSRPAAKFLVVLVMIRSWFQKQKQSQSGGANPAAPTETPPASYPRRIGGGDRPSASATPVPQPPQQPDYATTASTPLELLSEVATNNSVATTRSSTTADLLPPTTSTSLQPTAPSPWLSRQQQQQQPLLYDSTSPASQQQQQQPTDTTTPYLLPHQQQQQAATATTSTTANFSAPWLPSNILTGGAAGAAAGAGDIDYDYTLFEDGFAQAVDLTFGGFVDGGFGADDGAVRYMMQRDPGGWFAASVGGGGDSMAGGFGF